MTEPGLSIPGPHFTKPEYELNKNLTYLLYLVYLIGHDKRHRRRNRCGAERAFVAEQRFWRSWRF